MNLRSHFNCKILCKISVLFFYILGIHARTLSELVQLLDVTCLNKVLNCIVCCGHQSNCLLNKLLKINCFFVFICLGGIHFIVAKQTLLTSSSKELNQSQEVTTDLDSRVNSSLFFSIAFCP